MRLWASVALLSAAFPIALAADSTLTILHFNDAESHLVANELSGPDPHQNCDPANKKYIGGAAAFVSLMDKLRMEAATDGVITISAGDNFLCGIEHDAGDSKLNPANSESVDYDAVFFAAAKVDAAIPGNHEFDPGPEACAQFIAGVHTGKTGAIEGFNTRFLACNLDASACPALASKLAPAAIIESGRLMIGIVGDVTWELESISNPQPVKTIDADGDGDSDLDDIAILVQRQIDRLTVSGIDKIILISHLQSVRNDQALVRKLRGVDVAISGGGHEILCNDKTVLHPLMEAYGPYPLLNDASGSPVLDLDGVNVPVVVAGSSLKYIGKLVVTFDEEGRVLAATGDTIPAISTDPSKEDCGVYKFVEKPVSNFVHSYDDTPVATSDIVLDCTRENVRSRETNFGDLVADAVLYCARNYAKTSGSKSPDVAVINGGGIRSWNRIPKGEITNHVLRSTLPFHNSVTIVQNVSPATFKALAENMVANIEKLGGSFGQIAGFHLVYDPTMPRGNRVIDIVLSDGRAIARGGKITNGAPDVTLATLDYLALGGDGCPLKDCAAIKVGVVEWQAASDFLTKTLGGKISAKDYPECGQNRISCAVLERNNLK
jgi:5'-nucleotidase / UDP-sugar diphosphatase